MTEQRQNGLGQTVEFNDESGRWDKVVKAEATEVSGVSDAEVVTTEEAGTGDPAPAEDETVVSEGEVPARRARLIGYSKD